MLTPSQTKSATLEALNFIDSNPLAANQALREHLQSWMVEQFKEQPEYWGEATEVVCQDIVLLEHRTAFALADKNAKDAIEAQVLADWKARMDAPVVAAPVYATTVTPVAPKTYAEHIDAIRTLYDGTDPENRAFDLAAACRYALANGITADQVAGATGRHHSDCSAVMYPAK